MIQDQIVRSKFFGNGIRSHATSVICSMGSNNLEEENTDGAEEGGSEGAAGEE